MIVEKLPCKLPPTEVYQRLRQIDEPAWLDSAEAGGPRGEHSIIAVGWQSLLITDAAGNTTLHNQGEEQQLIELNPLAALDAIIADNHRENTTGFPFAGGLIGYLSYDLCQQLEAIPLPPANASAMPRMNWQCYDAALTYDHETSEWHFVSSAKEPPLALLAKVKECLAADSGQAAGNYEVNDLRSNFSENEFCAAVERARTYIASGDVYQVNLSQQYSANWQGDPLALYKRLREISPAPYAALLPLAGGHLLSSSPELFLRVRGNRIETRPIKGTRPRDASATTDALNRAELLTSEKERAELLMIADLERNDLGRICQPGTVHTSELHAIEEYPHVFHQIAHIQGTIKPGMTPGNILRATFPGGSITGAPKIRAMQIISELEPVRRGPYCGSMGWIGYDGAMELNIAIRTLVIQSSRVMFNVGGGIVWDSIPAQEYQETLHKAAGMLIAIGLQNAEVAHDR